MPDNAPDPALLPLARHALQHPSPWLRFATTLERHYLRQSLDDRIHRYRVFGYLGVVCYLLFGLLDYVALRDVFAQIWPWRFVVLPAWMLLSLHQHDTRRHGRHHDLLLMLSSTLAAMSVNVFFSRSSLWGAEHYYAGTLLCTTYLILVFRPPFAYALAGSAIVSAHFVWVTQDWPLYNDEMRHIVHVIFGSTILLTLAGGYQMEASSRRGFVLGLLREYDRQALQQRNSELLNLSQVDGLTGIYNRRYFDQYLQQCWQAAIAQQRPLSLLMLDVDFFKRYNDSYGHLAGDDVLRQLARACRQHCTGPGMLAARYGGEEFVLLLPDTTQAAAAQLAGQLQHDIAALQLPHRDSPAASCITVSIGVACQMPGHNRSPQALIAHADDQLYRAKQRGRNTVVAN